MAKPRLEVLFVSDEGPACLKRPWPAFEDDQAGYKRPRTSSPDCPMEWETSLPLPPLPPPLPPPPPPPSPPQPRAVVASSPACPPAKPLFLQRQRRPPRRAPYDPNDFTSDDLDPALEWPRDSPSRKCGAEVSLLQSVLGQFPLGLRLDKLVTLMWKEHKVHLWKLSVQLGYGDIVRFLEEVPGVRLSLSKGGSRYLVHIVGAC
ncbi:uncharacterized protein LOC143825020 [Paroedura picta]|uniref:uncharacterized protein LOC143825020 n=1 Tax=Paroedura picta TaxID=143630 RepID=UPI004057A939